MARAYFGLVLGLGTLLFTACGPSKEFLDRQAALQRELDEAHRRAGNCSEEAKRFQKQSDECQKQLADLASQNEKLSDKLLETERNLKTALAAANANADKQAAQLRDLQNRLRDVITGGKIKVTMRKGRIIISLPNDVLFDSGKIQLKSEGQTALEQVAQALAGLSDRRFIVFGNTDNVPIKTSRFPSNWELSADRAVEVVKSLISYGVNPENLTAAGSGEFDPIVDNSTTEGRAKNRRIEIVLEPNLKDLPGLSD